MQEPPIKFMETVLATRQLTAERKSIALQICENQRGRFLRITETSAKIDNVVIVPDAGIACFAAAIQDLIEEAGP
jgi:hypothetical protein